ncbi:MAG: putative ubiquitin carboxyl-terminal hydrolase 3 [Streblomastix strix]|uniref:Ubiquitin carboxyl-terminal hydrolase n=1 Tax=Streblomastix strix TaxID=222440 RepID=A0A5J4VP61_9EUKA|nr:MAG: putative ubiquitin carboxyl-terminal hydrolase 3 [Streblomastix strix]
MELVHRWLPLESNPDVLDTYTHSLGLSEDFAHYDVLGFDDDLLEMVPKPIHAVYLLYPYQGTNFEEKDLSKDGTLFFLTQNPEIGEACGTIAVLNALGNLQDKIKLKDDSFFKRFFSGAISQDPDKIGEAIMSDQALADAHKNAASSGQSEVPAEGEPTQFHFIAFVERGGKLLEFDGLIPKPIDHGPIPEGSSLLAESVTIIKEMVEESDDQTRFSMIVMSDKQAEE